MTLWVVEILMDGTWKSTTTTAFERAHGREMLADMKKLMPDAPLRLRLYRRVEDA